MPFWWERKKKKNDDFDIFRAFDDDFEERIFEDMKRMDEMFKSLMSPEMIKKLQESGGKPIVSGFSMRIGPDGKVDFKPFGNVQPVGEKPVIRDEREPLVDIINKPKEITIIAELPGVDKKEIKLKVVGNNDVLDIFVPHKFSKKVKLPKKVKPKFAKAIYKNGVLEVNLVKEKEDKEVEGEIPVE
jgi:HSP20 family protein